MRFARMVLAVCSGVLAAVLGAQVRFAEKNIDWGAVAESEVERVTVVPSGGRLLASTPGEEIVLEKRTLTLPSGNKLRITERIETDEAGEEARVFVEGKQLGEMTVVATPETLEAVLAYLRGRGYAITARYGKFGRILRVRLPAAEQSESAAVLGEMAALGATSAAHTQVRFFLPHVITPASEPNDPRYRSGEQWGLEKIHAPEVWAKGFLGYPHIPCAVYDTGVHLEHEDLQENVHTRESVLNSSRDPEDHHGHGSHCLGIMGADSNNGKGIAGVGQVANLTSLRGPISYWQEGDDILAGYQYALDHNLKVLSCSFGTSPGVGIFAQEDVDILNDLGENGTLVVIAAGNDGNDNDRVPTYPSSYDCENILTVIASDKADRPVIAGNVDDGEGEHVWSTSYGATSCDIAAPGANILSCTRDGPATYEKWSGTSMATPMVAACAAMLWEQNPSWSPLEIKRRLMETADVNSALLGYCQSSGRVNLARALDQSSGYISVAPLERTVLDAGQALTLTLTTRGVSSLTFRLFKRGQSEEVMRLTPTPHSGNTYTVWTPEAANVGRGYYVRVESETDPEQVFAYSSLFRVRDPETPETLTVSVDGATQPLAADNFTVRFTPSAAVMADVALEEEVSEGEWQLVATLGQMACTPGTEKVATMQLKGRGWLEGTYRVRVYDTDAPEVSGASSAFTFGTSRCAVYLLPGEDITGAPDDYKTRREEYLARWQESYAAGTPFRLNCYFPESSLYWLYLIDLDSNEIYLLKQVWADARSGLRSFRSFDLAIPEHFTPGHTYRLRLYDAFAPEMYQDSKDFRLLARADGRTVSSLDAVLGAPEGTGFYTNGQWYPVWQDNAWALRCGWLSPGDEAYFETVLTTAKPQRLTFSLNFPTGLSGAELSVVYAEQFPTNTSTWHHLCNKTFSGGSESGWNTFETDVDLPTGTHTLRWRFVRDPNAKVEPGEASAFSLALRAIAFADSATEPTLSFDGQRVSINGSGVATLTGRGPYPEFIAYTLDGSEPTLTSPRWVAGQCLAFSDSATLKVKAFLPGATPSKTVTAVFLKLEGQGTEADPYQLSSAADLLAFASAINLGTLLEDGWQTFLQDQSFDGRALCLTRDLDLSGVTLPTAGFLAFQAGMQDTASFQGLFDGRGHRLIRPTFTPTHSPAHPDGVGQFCGFIGHLGNFGALKNLTLLDPVCRVPLGGTFAIAPLVCAADGLIENCHVLRATSETPGPPTNAANPLYALTSVYTQSLPVLSSAYGCTLNGEAVANIAGWDEKLLAKTFLPPPVLFPAPGPLFETTEVTLSAPEGAYVQQWDGKDWVKAPPTLAITKSTSLVLRTTDGTDASAEVVATYDLQSARPKCPAVAVDTTDGTPLSDGVALTPFVTYAQLSAVDSDASAGGWRIHYTLDGSEPTEASPRYTEPFLLPGECTLRARIFNPPNYRPGPDLTYHFTVSPQETYLAALTLVHATRTAPAGEFYQSQSATVVADAPEAGMTFSHWQVRGPLVLEDPTANPLTFRYMTPEAVTLEAIYTPLRPGYRLRLQ